MHRPKYNNKFNMLRECQFFQKSAFLRFVTKLCPPGFGAFGWLLKFMAKCDLLRPFLGVSNNSNRS
jgi:hypothetical protein